MNGFNWHSSMSSTEQHVSFNWNSRESVNFNNSFKFNSSNFGEPVSRESFFYTQQQQRRPFIFRKPERSESFFYREQEQRRPFIGGEPIREQPFFSGEQIGRFIVTEPKLKDPYIVREQEPSEPKEKNRLNIGYSTIFSQMFYRVRELHQNQSFDEALDAISNYINDPVMTDELKPRLLHFKSIIHNDAAKKLFKDSWKTEDIHTTKGLLIAANKHMNAAKKLNMEYDRSVHSVIIFKEEADYCNHLGERNEKEGDMMKEDDETSAMGKYMTAVDDYEAAIVLYEEGSKFKITENFSRKKDLVVLKKTRVDTKLKVLKPSV